MSDNSKIEWTDATWNPIVGCRHVSEGCRNCYAAREASGRLARLPRYKGLAKGGKWVGKTRFAGIRELRKPLHWRRPRRVFVCSMGDLFAHKVREDIHEIFDVMGRCPQHQFLVLTKRPERIYDSLYGDMGGYYLGGGDYYPHILFGTSVENQAAADKHVPELLGVAQNSGAPWRFFVSCEPLLGPVNLLRWLREVPRLGWVIAGGESGPGARPMHPNWVRRLREQCHETGTPFFFKSWGAWRPARSGDADNLLAALVEPDGSFTTARDVALARHLDGNEWAAAMVRVGKKRAGRLLDGREHNAMSEINARRKIINEGRSELYDKMSATGNSAL